MLSPGTYIESEITIDKLIVITSEWKLDGDVSKIENTIVDAGDKGLFAIKTNGVEILGGFKRFGKESVIINNLFYQNGATDFIEIDPNVTSRSNLLGIAPLHDEKTFAPLANSPCIDSGGKYLDLPGK